MAQLAAHETFFFDDADDRLSAAQETQRSLVDTQERLGMMLDIMPMGLLIHTEQGILFANREACSMLGTGHAQVIGHHLLDYVGTDEFDSVRLQFEDSFKNETSMHKQETTLRRTDGTELSIKLLSCRLPWKGTPVVQVLLQDVTDLKMKEHKLRLLTITDELTGAYNRRHAFDVAAHCLDGADGHTGCPLSVVSLDIDQFKKINDTRGHATGDLALKHLAMIGRAAADDQPGHKALFARIGGEEFLLLLPGTSSHQAAVAAECMRSDIAKTTIELPDGLVRFTASFGVTGYRHGDAGLDALLSRADAALYAAKHGGRNKVVVA